MTAWCALLMVLISFDGQGPDDGGTVASVVTKASPAETASDGTLRLGPAEVDDPAELFVRANQAYAAGDHAAAIAIYRKLVDRGHDSGHVFYNLGNAHLRRGDVGRSISSFLKAQARMPRDQDLAANLVFARSTTKDAISPPQDPLALRTLFFWHYTASRAELLQWFVVVNALLWGMLLARLYLRRAELVSWLGALLAVLLIALGGSLLVRTVSPRVVAVVLPAEADVHAATDIETVVRFKLHAGTEVLVLGRRQGWVQIGLPDGERGWLRSDQAEIVER